MNQTGAQDYQENNRIDILPNHFGSISDHLHVHTACAVSMSHEIELRELGLKYTKTQINT